MSALNQLPNPIGLRKSPRRTLESYCGVLHRGNFELSLIHQIGEGGMLLESGLPLKSGDFIIVTLRIPGSGHFSTRLEVLYELDKASKNPQFGSKFVDLPLKAKRWIRAYVAAKTEEEAELDLPSKAHHQNHG